jgi:hypothetical protein
MDCPPTPPGTLIELQATAGGNVAVCQLVVRNKAYDGLTLFYDLSRPWCEIMAGARVRFLQRVSPNSEPEVFEGWTLRDGSVLTEHGVLRR